MQEKVQVRIVSGSLRGRKLTVVVSEAMRPTPQMVREALFSILGNAVPDTPFFDVFGGTGVVGLEAISRGASLTTFVERDFALADNIEKAMRAFSVQDRGIVMRTDVYRWAERWRAPEEPTNIFLSPPFPDLTKRQADFVKLVDTLYTKSAPGSVTVLQVEDPFDRDMLPDPDEWECRKYGRNLLLIRQKELPFTDEDEQEIEPDDA